MINKKDKHIGQGGNVSMKVDFKVVRQSRKHADATPPTNAEIKASIRVVARQARYNSENNPVLTEFNKKIREIRMSS